MSGRRVSLSYLPTPRSEYVSDFGELDGGLNLYDLDYRLKSNESPEMENLHWRDGALSCRDGQSWLSSSTELGKGYTCYGSLFWGRAFFHIGSGIYCARTDATPFELEKLCDMAELYEDYTEGRGTFFRYGDYLFYKAPGVYVRINYADGAFEAKKTPVYTPVVLINTHPTTHAGSEYQPENRLSAQKEVWYDAEDGVTVYHLPVTDVDSVDKVIVDGAEKVEETDYTVDLAAGTVTFAEAPPVSDPFFSNTVKITYTKENPAAYSAVMDCPYAIVYGGDQNLCVVMGGCPAQPNAYFWNGNHIAMDAGYFPVDQYNLAGDTEEEITAFGKQQDYLVIFKTTSVGRATIGTTTTSTERLLIEMPYTAINARIGCDLPWTVQLIDNNLVFCNTTGGVYMVYDSSAAYENNILHLSKKIDGTRQRDGLLKDVKSVSPDDVCSVDDDTSYWVVANGHAYVWDYGLSTYKKPSWFYYTNINARAFCWDDDRLLHLDSEGRVTLFSAQFSDYEEPINKVYRFATLTFGTYDRLKDVESVIIAVRSDTDTEMLLTYITDYEDREDLTPIYSWCWNLVPRNLTYRSLAVDRFAAVARRQAGCKNIRHFSMRLTNNALGKNMGIVSAQVLYKFSGRFR